MLRLVAPLTPALGEIIGTAATIPESVGKVLTPVAGSLPNLLQPVQKTVPELLAPVGNALPTLPGIGKIEPPLGAVTTPLPDLPSLPSGPGGPAGSAPGDDILTPAAPVNPADPFGPGSPVGGPAPPAAGSGGPGEGSFLSTPLSPLTSSTTNALSARAAPPATPGNGPEDSPSTPLPAPGPAFSTGGVGGWFFVPLAALMALVGLSAPAILRRLRESAALPSPTPFVCALERPG